MWNRPYLCTYRAWVPLLCVLSVVPGRTPARAQPEAPELPAPAPDPAPDAVEDDQRDAAEVYLNDSLKAADAFSQTRTLLAESRWREAAETLYTACEEAGDALIAVAPGRYKSVRLHVAETLAEWPPQALDGYRTLADPQVLALIRRVGDSRKIADFLEPFEQYFAATPTARLADRIGQLAIEAGDLALAEYVYRRVVEAHPDGERFGDAYRAMLAVIAAMRGRSQAATPTDATVRWMGQDRPVSEVIEFARGDFASMQAAEPPSDWPTLGGDATRNRLARTTVDEPGLVWRTALEAVPEADPDGPEPWLEDESSIARRVETATMFPVVHSDLLIAQKSRRTVALHLNTGAVAWRFPNDAEADETTPFHDDDAAGWASPTVHDGRVFATLPVEEPLFYQYDPGRRGAELICLRESDGRLLWRVDAPALGLKTAELAFDPSPLVQGDDVFVIARRRRTFGFEDCYLHRFRASDGAAGEFRVHLGSASTSAYGGRTASVAALHDGTVYVASGLGSIAAVSAHTGDVRWLAIYPRAADRIDGETGRSRSDRRQSLNPLTLSDGRLVAFPVDAEGVLLLDAGSGEILHTIPADELSQPRHILGLHRDLLVAVGDRVVCYDVRSKTTRWAAELPEGFEAAGRGVRTGDEVLVPTREGVSRFNLGDGSRTDHPWDALGSGGNLIALPDRWIVAEPGAIAAYLHKPNIWKSLRDRMSASPDDPLPALEFVEVALGAGELDQALSVLDEAVRRLSARRISTAPDGPAPPESGLRQRLFADVLKLASATGEAGRTGAASSPPTEEPSRPPNASSTLRTLCSYAADHAVDPAANVEYRMHFGRLFEQTADPAYAVRLYQQILLDRSLRPIGTRKHDPAARTAATEAERKIAALIEQHGRSVFAEFERQAASWLSSAGAAAETATREEDNTAPDVPSEPVRDVDDAFRRIVESFPNSRAAGQALVAHADWLRTQGRPEAAWRRLARAYTRYGDAVDRAAVARNLADSLADCGRPAHAYRWLTKASREVPGGEVRVGSRSLSLLEYRERFADAAADVEPALPRLKPPLRAGAVREVEQNASLLRPRFPGAPRQDWSRYFVADSNAVTAFAADTGERLWEHELEAAAEISLLASRKDLILLGTRFEVFALDAHTGATRWTFGHRPAHLLDPAADWEDGSAFRAHELFDDRLVSFRDDGNLSAVAIDSGERLWQHTSRPAALGPLRAAYPWIAYATVGGDANLLCLADADTGEWMGTIPTGRTASVEDLLVTLGERAVVVTSNAVAAFDLPSRTPVWRSAIAGRARSGSIVLDWDAVYVSDNGLDLRKIRLADGAAVWQSDPVAHRGTDDLDVQLADGALIATTSSSIVATDTITGLTLWSATVPQRPRFTHRLMTRDFVIAIDTSRERHPADPVRQPPERNDDPDRPGDDRDRLNEERGRPDDERDRLEDERDGPEDERDRADDEHDRLNDQRGRPNDERNGPDDDRPTPANNEPPVIAWFYRHSDGSGILPPDGRIDLGPLDNIRTVLAVDGALIVHADNKLLRFQAN